MQAKDMMTTNVITVLPETPVQEIAQLMQQHRISGVPVVDRNGKVFGLVSEGDLMRRIADEDRHRSWWLSLFHSKYENAEDFAKARGRYARDVATRNVISVKEETPAGEIARLLESRQIKRVLVMRGDKLLGIVSRGDLLRGLASAESELPSVAADDQALRAAVEKALKEVPGLDVAYIGVNVKDGVAEIWGIANSPDYARAARVAGESVPGVKEARVQLGQVPPWAWGT